jgi:NAD(P)-dependent dehydrogenase (short-subunit alcohol dehydrogenase family)
MRPQLLDNKVAIITGAARGIGKAIAEVFINHGAILGLVDLDEAPLLETSAELRKTESATTSVYCRALDVSSAEDFARFADDLVSEYGHVDVLVNNAAIQAPGELLNFSLSEWNRVMAVNFTSYLTCAQIVYRVGGGVTSAVLPHHRTYGSVYGGS